MIEEAQHPYLPSVCCRSHCGGSGAPSSKIAAQTGHNFASLESDWRDELMNQIKEATGIVGAPIVLDASPKDEQSCRKKL